MQTELKPEISNTPVGAEADRILRTCVHCGFCLATCPTYRLLSDELDSPRGRIYLIKSLLEGKPASDRTLQHLDRCLTCRACETTCPSGVEYGKLLEIGRDHAEQELPRSIGSRIQRWLLRQVLPYRSRFAFVLRLGQWLRPLLPTALRHQIPPRSVAHGQVVLRSRRERRVILFQGCVQPSLAPNINAAARKILNHMGIDSVTVRHEGCCGALDLHLGATATALSRARRNIEHWWPYLEQGAEAILVTASGCGVTVKDYGRLLQHDARYAERAARISELAMDPAEYLLLQDELPMLSAELPRMAFQSPCTLQHGQKLDGITEGLLKRLGFDLIDVPDAGQCCGSAGTYSLLQPELSEQLRSRKLATLQQNSADVITTANIGCLMHLQQAADRPVKHWLECVDAALPAAGSLEPKN